MDSAQFATLLEVLQNLRKQCGDTAVYKVMKENDIAFYQQEYPRDERSALYRGTKFEVVKNDGSSIVGYDLQRITQRLYEIIAMTQTRRTVNGAIFYQVAHNSSGKEFFQVGFKRNSVAMADVKTYSPEELEKTLIIVKALYKDFLE